MVTQAQAHRIAARRSPASLAVPVFGSLLLLAVALWLGRNIYENPSNFFQVLLIGVTVGALYGLVALGYTLVYGILELINFAHGDVFMLGGMISATLVLSLFHLGENPSIGALIPAILACLAVAMVGCGVINVTVELIAYRPLRRAPRLAPLITAIGMSFILDRKSTRLNSSHIQKSRMPSSA